MITAPQANLHRVSMVAILLGAATSSGPVMAQPLDLDDFAPWPTCVTGPANGPVTQGCESLDRDGDDDIDLRDFGGLQTVFGLTGLNADHCTDANALAG